MPPVDLDFQPRTRLVFGANSVDRLGVLAQELGAHRVFVVSDPGIVRAGHTERGLAALRRVGLATMLFDGTQENPTTETVARALDVAESFQPDLIVGLGGGSSMDCAKGVNFLYSCGGRMQDYWGRGKATGPMLPMIGVPTTAGTGSEAQSFALISDAETHVKMACGDPRAACAVAVLDPTLTVTQPRMVTALTGLDAMTHALETWVTRPRNAISTIYSREGWRLLHQNFARVLDDPTDLDARGNMQLGAFFAGLAIETSMLGAAHALANPLTAEYSIVHGQAVSLMLPHVIEYNAAEFGDLYAELTASTNGGPVKSTGGAAALADFFRMQTSKSGLKTRLAELNIQRDSLPRLASAAAQQWTAGFNPRMVKEADLLLLYEQAF
jgi:alcohol dehydrogenase